MAKAKLERVSKDDAMERLDEYIADWKSGEIVELLIDPKASTGPGWLFDQLSLEPDEGFGLSLELPDNAWLKKDGKAFLAWLAQEKDAQLAISKNKEASAIVARLKK